MKKQTKTKTSKVLVAGSVIECVNAKPANRKLNRIALKEGSSYVVLVHIVKGMDKNGVIKDSVIVAELSMNGEITQLKYPYCWDAKRFKLITKKNYFTSDKSNLFSDEVKANAYF